MLAYSEIRKSEPAEYRPPRLIAERFACGDAQESSLVMLTL